MTGDGPLNPVFGLGNPGARLGTSRGFAGTYLCISKPRNFPCDSVFHFPRGQAGPENGEAICDDEYFLYCVLHCWDRLLL
jgi:hypothetical protein